MSGSDALKRSRRGCQARRTGDRRTVRVARKKTPGNTRHRSSQCLSELIDTWRIGGAVWRICTVGCLPPDADSACGLCDPLSRRIYILSEYAKDDNVFLGVLFHELAHAIEDRLAIDEHHELSRLLVNGSRAAELHDDITTDQLALSWLWLIVDNEKNVMTILEARKHEPHQNLVGCKAPPA